MGHGKVGRTFAGRILQVITGSTGLDDFEWGVTLFGVHPDDLKDCVYEMRFDEGSAYYAEFGPFYTGMVGDARHGARRAGLVSRPIAMTRLPRHAARTSCASSGGWWWPSAAAPTRPCWPRWPTTPWAATRCCAPRPSRPRWPRPRPTTAGPWPTEWDLRWVGVPTDEMDDPDLRANGADRCARCKTALMSALGPWPRPSRPGSSSA